MIIFNVLYFYFSILIFVLLIYYIIFKQIYIYFLYFIRSSVLKSDVSERNWLSVEYTGDPKTVATDVLLENEKR